MLVQDRAAPSPSPAKPPKSQIRDLATHQQIRRRFTEPKNLDFSTCFSENLTRIALFSLFTVTIVAFFFLYNTTDTASLLCFQSQSTHSLQSLSRPQINWNSIQVLPKTSPFANFLTEKWIVVSVTKYPTEELKSLVKIRGWQVLAIGNSVTPKDWSLKGSIFLSLDAQAELGFRVLDHLPYDSFVRKSVGYLFAIQHGAKKIYDADDRGEVIDGDLGKHFDVELVGKDSKQEPILQYSHENPNRTVVNPYIHFGQRSVWPRGLPLEDVGEVNHEEYYTEVFGGKQFIQQGISNGLPDVDSVFYFTRKTTLEAFDIKFDEHAPKVALPQGVMVPVNSFNTLYHSSAFWGLMLPVSVSSMASDVLRGYWGQRLLWELGGYVAVYPPTAHRFDRIEAYPFAEEKDLHVNVGRLIDFLLVWRSDKHSFFETILDLSFAMAEEGFWTEQDVKFTAAWLQDLIAVGYQQPRLMSLELDRPRASIGHGDRKEFVPRKLPSVHLGVEETGTVSTEIGNLIRWRKNFGNVVLVMFCSGPVERTALEWRLLYGRIFKTVVILSSQKNSDLYVEEAKLDHIYKHLPKIFDRYSSAEGFLFVEDDTILNYWNLLQADKSKIWTTDKVSKSWTSVKPTGNSDWFSVQAELVKNTVSTMPAHFQVNYKDATKNNHETLTVCSSEVFYVPKRLVTDFTDLVDLVGDMDLHYKVAVPMFFLSMDSPQNFDPVLGSMVYKRKSASFNTSSSLYSPKAPAVHPWSISSEQDFIKLVQQMAEGDPLLLELV
ncbi:PREDICTED: probable glycosyltransferase STELLO1 isoform X2 [Camelina sativa]|uniref:Probable glycosyltransferase STELLO1 isoform X1 n=1 Tax=Camelina sativa TaxID=90675 RepID=A0ABM1RQD3_CAMSA|nr:PREDICTED: probable glycosyltransferase STELLO1 isoform X1 [Camelina sativa]XP_019101221.1 PREDICTED: probable glycosyltransferase STELLO1 isoform X2 [Camelina sativa]